MMIMKPFILVRKLKVCAVHDMINDLYMCD